MISKEKSIIISRMAVVMLMCLIFISLTSCSRNTTITPDSIIVDGQPVKYMDTKSDIDSKLGEGIPTQVMVWDGFDYKNLVDIMFNDDDNSRYIKVISKKVKTFNNIIVGDNADKVVKKYKYETESSGNYSVAFDGNKEVDSKMEMHLISEYGLAIL